MHASRKTARAMRCQSGSRFIVVASRLPRSANTSAVRNKRTPSANQTTWYDSHTMCREMSGLCRNSSSSAFRRWCTYAYEPKSMA